MIKPETAPQDYTLEQQIIFYNDMALATSRAMLAVKTGIIQLQNELEEYKITQLAYRVQVRNIARRLKTQNSFK